MKIHQQIEQWLNDADVQRQSRKLYHYLINKYFLWVHDHGKNPNDITRADIIQYKSYLEKSNFTTATCKNYYTAVRLFYHWANQNNHHADVSLGIRPPKYDNSFKKYPLTRDQVDQLLASINRSTNQGKRDYAMLFMMITTGMRRSEIRNINIGDIHENGVYILAKGSTKKDTWVALTDEMMDALNECMLCRRDWTESDPLFSSMRGVVTTNRRMNINGISTHIKRKLKKIGLHDKYYTCHSLRHTTATLLMESGYELQEVQHQLRHKSSTITQLYTRVISEKMKRENKGGKALSKLFYRPTSEDQ